MANPFRSLTQGSQGAAPCVLVIFGASGDLTHRKLVPALYNLAVDGLLPANFSLIGAARRDLSDELFREGLRDSVDENSRRKPLDLSLWAEFAKHSFYVRCPFDEAAGYASLKEKLDQIDRAAGSKCTRVFYLATGPEHFELIAGQLGAAGLLRTGEERAARPRLIVEKPFGHDLVSARMLNRALLAQMSEDQIYRIDHYLGKETVQNLSVFRFSNGIFEPLWNRQYIEHVEISVCESIGVGSRGGYFDKAGILRDIVQNHALQLLCLVALEPPVVGDADPFRDEKVKVLRSVRRIPENEVGDHVVRAHYGAGSVGGEQVCSYLEEQGVSPDSKTETYVALELAINNWRWAGVPFFIRAGKRLAKRVTEISIHFKNVPYLLFREEDIQSLNPNILSFQIQPDEGISISVSSKPPGPKIQVQTVNMDFRYGTSFGVEPPEAYERLLLDCMRGDATLFTRDDEIEQAWEIVQPLLESWAGGSGRAAGLCGYEAGSWGPAEADQLLSKHIKRGWHRL
jgi:glucose-6-phosphate 1-dehydrogenase